MRDLFNRTTIAMALKEAAIATNTTTVGDVVDRKGQESFMFVLFSGTVTDGTFVPLVEHDDVVGFGGAAAVPDNQLHSTEVAEQFVAADDDLVKKIGYRGEKRFVRLSIVSTGVTTGVDSLGAVAVMGHRRSHGAAV